MQNAALVLIDWQQGFGYADYWGNRNNPEAERNASQVIEHAREQGLTVIHVHHMSETKGSPLAADRDGSKPQDFAKPKGTEQRFTKAVNSAFIGTDLETALKKQKIDTLYICGISTDHCVSTSVRMAANLGFKVNLIADACFTFDRQTVGGDIVEAETVHQVQLASLKDEFATILKTAEFIKDDFS